MTGVELGGALKNVMAIATGIADGLELGYNARAALLTRGLAEITRLGVALGARPADVRRARGAGRPDPDLHRRAVPEPPPRARPGARDSPWPSGRPSTRSVAEGVRTAQAGLALARRAGVDAPIIAEVARGALRPQGAPGGAPRAPVASRPGPEEEPYDLATGTD